MAEEFEVSGSEIAKAALRRRLEDFEKTIGDRGAEFTDDLSQLRNQIESITSGNARRASSDIQQKLDDLTKRVSGGESEPQSSNPFTPEYFEQAEREAGVQEAHVGIRQGRDPAAILEAFPVSERRAVWEALTEDERNNALSELSEAQRREFDRVLENTGQVSARGAERSEGREMSVYNQRFRQDADGKFTHIRRPGKDEWEEIVPGRDYSDIGLEGENLNIVFNKDRSDYKTYRQRVRRGAQEQTEVPVKGGDVSASKDTDNLLAPEQPGEREALLARARELGIDVDEPVVTTLGKKKLPKAAAEKKVKGRKLSKSSRAQEQKDDVVQTPEEVAEVGERAGRAQEAMEVEKKRMPPPLPQGHDASLSKQIEYVRAMMKAEKEQAASGIGKTFVKWRPEGETQTLAEHMGEPEENWERKTVPGVTEDQARVFDSTIERTLARGERRDEDPSALMATWQQRFKEEKQTLRYWLTPRFMRRYDPEYGSLRNFWERTLNESKERRVGILPMLLEGRRGTVNAPLTLSAEAVKGLREHHPNTPDGHRWMALATREVEMQREIYARGYTKFFERKNFNGVRNAMVIGASAGLIAAAFLSSGILAPVAAGAVGGLTGTHMRNYLRNNEAKGAFVLPILWGGLWSFGTNMAAQSYGLDQVVEEQLKKLSEVPKTDKVPLVDMKPQVPPPMPDLNQVPSYGGEGVKPSPLGTESIINNDKSAVTTGEIIQRISPSMSFPAEYTVSAGDSVARHGVDGFIRTGFFDTAYFKQLGLSDLARNQFIEAVRDVFTQNPDLAEQFGGRIVEGRNGLDLAFSAGDKLDASVWREPEFLKELGERLRSGNYTAFDNAMRGRGGVQAIIKQLAAIKYT